MDVRVSKMSQTLLIKKDKPFPPVPRWMTCVQRYKRAASDIGCLMIGTAALVTKALLALQLQ